MVGGYGFWFGREKVMGHVGRRAGWAAVVVAAWLAAWMAVLAGGVAVARAAPVDRCLAIAKGPGGVHLATVQPAKLALGEVGLTFVGHATFEIESAAGIRIATDFNDLFRPGRVPDIVTMNRAHNTHFTDFPPAGIKHILRGWNPGGGPASHGLSLGDVRVRNVPTNTRWGEGGSFGAYGNSIFIFEIGGLCIGHLGHLHHTLTPQQLGAIGHMDVLLVPVDGGYTMDLGGMVEVLKSLHARLIIPMHYFSGYTLQRFLERVRDEFPVEMADSNRIVLSQGTLPAEPKILVLPGN